MQQQVARGLHTHRGRRASVDREITRQTHQHQVARAAQILLAERAARTLRAADSSVAVHPVHHRAHRANSHPVVLAHIGSGRTGAQTQHRDMGLQCVERGAVAADAAAGLQDQASGRDVLRGTGVAVCDVGPCRDRHIGDTRMEGLQRHAARTRAEQDVPTGAARRRTRAHHDGTTSDQLDRPARCAGREIGALHDVSTGDQTGVSRAVAHTGVQHQAAF